MPFSRIGTLNISLVHVEEFKKELSREVMGMTHEVGRLHKERQVLQQQIGDLFSFLNKQREEIVRLNTFYYYTL